MAIHDFPLSRTTSEANNLDALIREIYLLQQAGAVTCETSVTGLVDLISISNPALVPSLLRIIQDQDISISEENDVSQPTLDEPLTTTPAFITLENAVGLDREASPGLADYAASPVESSRSQGEDCDDHAPATSVERSSNASIGMEMVEVDALLDNENEKRTTVMIKKIPRRFTVAALRDLIERECPALRHGGYDLLYLPVDTAKVANRGYAFINFTTPRYLLVFTLAFQGYEWFPQRRRRSEGTTNTKACEIYFAHIQGRDATIRSVDPTGSKRSNSPNYESIGDGKVWILGFTDSRKKRGTTTTRTTSYIPPRLFHHNGVYKPHYARCLSNASTSSNTTPRGDSSSSSLLPLLNRAVSSSSRRQSPMLTSVSGCSRHPNTENHAAESSNNRARYF